MSLDEFLKQYVEGYLFCDLQKMGDISLKEGEEFGAAGYPILTAVTAGMELLGWLSRKSESEFNFSNYKRDRTFIFSGTTFSSK